MLNKCDPKNQLETNLFFEIQFNLTWPSSQGKGEPTDSLDIFGSAPKPTQTMFWLVALSS